MKTNTFLTFFPGYEDFHFWKDPGQIPYRFKRLGYNSKILVKKEGDFPITKRHVDVEYFKNVIIFKRKFGVIHYFIKNSKEINVLNIFHIDSFESLFVAFIYKLLNKKGFVYLKMDNCHFSGIYNWEKIFNPNINPAIFLEKQKENMRWNIKKFLIKNFFIKKVDLFSVEDDESKNYFENKYSFFKNKIVVAYNGHTIDLLNKNIIVKSFNEKENLIITVGRLGTFQKNTLNLLEGFMASAKKHSWNLELAGSINPNFIAEKDDFIRQHPELSSRIKFLGNLDKLELSELYNRAKIFLFPSLFEGFSIVFAEAMYFKNAIITSPYTSLTNIVNTENIGLIVEPTKPKDIGGALLELINNVEELENYCNNSRKFAEINFNWDNIANSINQSINNNRDHKNY